jgi:hypothetical protein
MARRSALLIAVAAVVVMAVPSGAQGAAHPVKCYGHEGASHVRVHGLDPKVWYVCRIARHAVHDSWNATFWRHHWGMSSWGRRYRCRTSNLDGREWHIHCRAVGRNRPHSPSHYNVSWRF